jgi:hypothetical protein
MPFITQDRRDLIDQYDIEELANPETFADRIQPGDRCYLSYKKMVDQWKANPCWTTAHEIHKDIVLKHQSRERGDGFASYDDLCAAYLAWQVFFQLHVIPYELEKRAANGDI